MNEALLGKMVGKLKFVRGFALLKLAELAKEAVATGFSLNLTEDTIVETALQYFDEYLKPRDWPFVDGTTEEELKNMARSFLEKTIRALIKD
jgi:hypothetical protein